MELQGVKDRLSVIGSQLTGCRKRKTRARYSRDFEITAMPCKDPNTALQDKHKLYMEALRAREAEALRFLAVLGPAIGAFIYLLQFVQTRYRIMFFCGSVGIQISLLLGAAYATSLGYNFRYIVFQMAKIESALGVQDFALYGWPRKLTDFRKCTYCCFPPEIIKNFWISYIVAIVAVTLVSAMMPGPWYYMVVAILVGLVCSLIALRLPRYYGKKFRKIYLAELKSTR